MLSRDLAEALRTAGLRWAPAKGDRFVVPERDLDDEVFVVSDMVVEALDVPDGGRVLAFNGTTEWALDSLEAREAIGCRALSSLPWPRGGYALSASSVPGQNHPAGKRPRLHQVQVHPAIQRGEERRAAAHQDRMSHVRGTRRSAQPAWPPRRALHHQPSSARRLQP